MSDFFKKSLANQIFIIMGLCFLIFIIGAGLLFYLQNKMNDEYIQQREGIQAKQRTIHSIQDQYQSNIFIMTDSLSFKVPENTEVLHTQESKLRLQMTKLNKLIETEEERSIYHDIDNFTTYYFTEVLPPLMKKYEKTKDTSADLTNPAVTSKVEKHLNEIESFSRLLQKQLEDNADKFTEKDEQIQNSIFMLFILFLMLIVFTTRMMFKKIGKPLAEFTFVANEIAAGRDEVIKVDYSNRQDELGSLSVAFQKMVISLQDKEQDLVAHNEELIAQQDELQAQQQELQSALEILTENEQKLTRRNDLINGISSSLDKDEVLQSIVKSMCKVTRSDKGIITYLSEEAFASYGISNLGVKQFKESLNSDFIFHLTHEKKAYTVKREQHLLEKGYHETLQYCYDLYLPVISSSEVKSILVFTRYGSPFSESELMEYETLTRQIAIYLEKIKLYEQSEDERHLNQDILNTVQEGIQLIDKDRKIIQVNQQLCDIFQWSNSIEEMLGLSWDSWSHIMAEQIQENKFIESLEDLINSALERPDEEHSFIYNNNSNNQVIRVYCQTFKKDGNEDFGTLLVHRDITKEYEVAKMKSELVSTVSHELRTPLASVLGFTELLLHKELKPERKTKYLKTIYNETQRLTALINDFLDIQRMESGRQTYDKKFIDIASILQHVVELQEVNTSIHNIYLSVELEETIILGDRNKIEQVFTNLLSNAMKYSPNGGDIFIRVYQSKDMISIDVRDEGLGIPEDAKSNIFQQFYRVDNSDRRKIGGTGLGLAIVQEIVKAHRGEVLVTSEYGKGSTFTTHFPRVLMKVNEQNEDELTSMPRYTVIIVEDDLSLSELLKHELEDTGFHVDCYNSGKKAFKQMEIAAPDAIVLDIMLDDEINGWTIMKEMKASEELKDIPIFVSTALDEKERGFSLGAEEYLIKPYQPSELSKLIMHTLLSNEKNGQIMVPHQQN